ncbi:ABC transporter permease [Shewanella marisflavi]|uniref:ABC transporter substrate-binding protein n=1 Tax=Shewanella marisflavi TaxID=260364 RepID=A0AAC9XN05_9GAMM|nr:FtsX-like permease family protein [Shewanella marisflavi]ASJ96173.1 ABC transporter substrate-binding protein [Shewanella marisflavi]
MLIKLAWRNLWRQKRRTLLTAFALSLALFLSLFTRSMQEGSYEHNIDNSARFSTGLIQLQSPEFAITESIEDLLPGDDAFIAPAKALPHITFTLPRIESFLLASSDERSKGVMVYGVRPEAENAYSGIADKLVAGEYLTPKAPQVLLGQGLAEYLKLGVGDELVLYGQGYHGQTAAGVYLIVGILRFPLAQLDNQLVYMPLSAAQELFSTGEQVTQWVLHSDRLDQVDQLTQQLSHHYGSAVKVRDWQSLAPEMAQQIALDRAGGLFMICLLYLIVGFALFATLLMMTLERRREFGVMLATGMGRLTLLRLLVIESGMIALLGMAMGLLVSLVVIGYFYFHPISLTGETAKMMLEMGWEPVIPMKVSLNLVGTQVLIVLALMTLCLLYPLWRTQRLVVVAALKGGDDAQ